MDDKTFLQRDETPRVGSAREMRLIEVLLTHNEPVSCEDLACALGLPRSDVRVLALGLQARGCTVVDVDHDTVEATPDASAF
jgi:DNA-binding IclR family transcriptional regulator